ncbi:MAG TPA: hypothetical protein VEZ11_02100 [Thermoanaerobaculia bacterium]|nr:hypothetical protein [Thermoanaerobaculia bacterium]
MSEEGPAIEALTHRLAETPAEFLEKPRALGGRIDVQAVAGDLLFDLGGEVPADRLTPFGGREPRRSALVLIASWLLHDAWFLERKTFAAAAYDFLRSDALDEIVKSVDPRRFVSDPDRREELARLALRALGLRPAGESEPQAADRLATLDTVGRERILRDTRAAQQRVREIQEAMRKKAAEEAASVYGRE